MSRIIIEVPDYNDSFSRIVLGGTAYLLRFTYNDTVDTWTFGIYDVQKNPIAAGLKIVPNFPLNLFYPSIMPPGAFLAITEQQHIGRSAFADKTAEFCWLPPEAS